VPGVSLRVASKKACFMSSLHCGLVAGMVLLLAAAAPAQAMAVGIRRFQIVLTFRVEFERGL
jgi:hypothetical protein